MIDIEFEVIDAIYKHLIEKYPNISFSSEYNPVPTHFPHVEIQEIDNRSLQDFITPNGETMAQFSYQIDIYSNKQHGRKSECKEIANHIDEWLSTHNFRRTYKTNVPNYNDGSIYRMIFRYVVKSDGKHLYIA